MIKRLLMGCLGFFVFSMLFVSTLPIVAQDCDSDDADTLADQADEASDDGDYDLAIQLYSCAIALEPETLAYINDRGIVYLDKGDNDLAEDDFELVILLDPTYPYAYNNLGIVHYRRGDYDLALVNYGLAIENELPNLHIPYYNRGLVRREQGNYDDALADFNQSIEINDTYDRAHLMRGRVYLILDDPRAHADFAEWIRLIEEETDSRSIDGSLQNETLSMTQGLVYEIEFNLEAGQEIRISARAVDADVDPLIVLLDQDGNAMISDDDSGVSLNAVIPSYTVSDTGTYTLLVSHAFGGSEGEISLTLDLGGDVVDSFSTYNLFPGEIAEVFTTGGDTLNLRSGPGLDFEILQRLEPTSRVILIEGPRKQDGYAWWRIEAPDGTIGWSVERADDEQTLQMALIIGEDVSIAVEGDTLNVRSGPGTENEIVIQLPDGVPVTLIGGPEVASNFRWWQIRTADGIEGWTIDRFQGERMLIPVKELDR